MGWGRIGSTGRDWTGGEYHRDLHVGQGGWLPAGACNNAFRGGKTDMYEGGIRVPCFVQWPDHIKAGCESDEIVMLMDFFPKFARSPALK